MVGRYGRFLGRSGSDRQAAASGSSESTRLICFEQDGDVYAHRADRARGILERRLCRSESPMIARPMPADPFWEIIERAARFDDDPEAHREALRDLLRELCVADIIAFNSAFRHYLNEAYTWDLAGAASVANSSCTDDGFEYFRRWLVSKGRDVYKAALTHPDSLADFNVQPGPGGFWEFESIYGVAQEVFAEKGGEGDVRDYCEPEAGLFGPGPPGEPLPEDDEDRALRYPKLSRRFARPRQG